MVINRVFGAGAPGSFCFCRECNLNKMETTKHWASPVGRSTAGTVSRGTLTMRWSRASHIPMHAASRRRTEVGCGGWTMVNPKEATYCRYSYIIYIYICYIIFCRYSYASPPQRRKLCLIRSHPEEQNISFGWQNIVLLPSQLSLPKLISFWGHQRFC